MNFVDTAINRAERFSIGQEAESGRYYLSFPVSNRLCDYEEYYELAKAVHDAYPANLEEVVAFARACKARLKDELLMVTPGTDRGVAS